MNTRQSFSASLTAPDHFALHNRPVLSLRQSQSEMTPKPFAVQEDSHDNDDVIGPISFDQITALTSLQSKQQSFNMDLESKNEDNVDLQMLSDSEPSTATTCSESDSYSVSEGHTHSLSPSILSNSNESEVDDDDDDPQHALHHNKLHPVNSRLDGSKSNESPLSNHLEDEKSKRVSTNQLPLDSNPDHDTEDIAVTDCDDSDYKIESKCSPFRRREPRNAINIGLIGGVGAVGGAVVSSPHSNRRQGVRRYRSKTVGNERPSTSTIRVELPEKPKLRHDDLIRDEAPVMEGDDVYHHDHGKPALILNSKSKSPCSLKRDRSKSISAKSQKRAVMDTYRLLEQRMIDRLQSPSPQPIGTGGILSPYSMQSTQEVLSPHSSLTVNSPQCMNTNTMNMNLSVNMNTITNTNTDITPNTSNTSALDDVYVFVNKFSCSANSGQSDTSPYPPPLPSPSFSPPSGSPTFSFRPQNLPPVSCSHFLSHPKPFNCRSTPNLNPNPTKNTPTTFPSTFIKTPPPRNLKMPFPATLPLNSPHEDSAHQSHPSHHSSHHHHHQQSRNHRYSEHNFHSSRSVSNRRRQNRHRQSLPPVRVRVVDNHSNPNHPHPRILSPKSTPARFQRGQSSPIPMQTSPIGNMNNLPSMTNIGTRSNTEHQHQHQHQHPSHIITAFNQHSNRSGTGNSNGSGNGNGNGNNGGKPGHQQYITPPNLSYYAFNHSNGTMTRLEINQYSSYSSQSPSFPTPVYSHQSPTSNPSNPSNPTKFGYYPRSGGTFHHPRCPSSPSSPSGHPLSSLLEDEHSFLMEDVSPVYLRLDSQGKYWDIAENEGALYKFSDFARAHFENVQRKSSINIFRSKSKSPSHTKGLKYSYEEIESLISFGNFKSLKQPLLKMTSRKMEKQATRIWKEIAMFMKMVKTKSTDQQHIERLLHVALHCGTDQVVRDEIYCLLCKQTNNRETKHVDQLLRAWKLMAICCSLFCPSLELVRYLASYLYRHSLDITFANGKISEYAKFSLHALDESMLNGPRKMIPTELETMRLLNRQKISIQIHFLDDTQLSLPVTSQTSVAQICEALADRLQLKYPEMFGLYEMEELLPRQYCQNELTAYSTRMDLNVNQKWKCIHLFPVDRPLADNERIMDVFSGWMQLQSQKNSDDRAFRFVFKCKMFHHDRLDQCSRTELKMMYLQNAWNVVRSQYPIRSETDLFHLAAIQFVAKYGTDSALNVHHLRDELEHYLPQSVRTKYSISHCERWILQNVDALCSNPSTSSPPQLWMHYIRYLSSIQSLNVHLMTGCTFFRCIYKSKGTDIVVGIGAFYVLLMDGMTRQIMEKYRLQEILTYGFRPREFVMVCGTLVQQKKYELLTREGRQMNDLLQQHIDIKSSRASFASLF